MDAHFSKLIKVFIVIYFTILISCNTDDQCTSGRNFDCGGQKSDDSFYILPYPSGNVYRVNQGNNNSCGGHQDAYMFGYDFDMPIGSVIIASRKGVVTETRKNNPDGSDLFLGNENLVKIFHEDGTTAAYSHMKQGSLFVDLGQMVMPGDTLGLSGNSGYTGNFPHLHFHVASCDEPTLPGCTTLLVKFKNTSDNPCGLIQNELYEAF